MDDFYKSKQFDSVHMLSGRISEKDKFLAAKQILLGLAILYGFTVLAYLFRPIQGERLLEICMTTFPPLTTLILVAYFKDKPVQ